MKVLIVSEGVHEIGHDPDTESEADRRGALRSLVQRLVPQITEIEPIPIRNKALDLEIQHGKGDGFFKRGMAILRYARKHGYDAAVILIDEDGDATRHRSFTQAQESSTFRFPRAFGVAVRTFDAWMLADESAFLIVFGQTIDRRPSPENLKEPKREFRSLMDALIGLEKSQAECYLGMAIHSRLEILEQRCPKGFKPFAERVRQLTSP